jgi:hypothetical protein
MNGWWSRRSARRHCPHSDLIGIYGDLVNAVGGWRLRCADCGRYLDGPVSLANSRKSEVEQ